MGHAKRSTLYCAKMPATVYNARTPQQNASAAHMCIYHSVAILAQAWSSQNVLFLRVCMRRFCRVAIFPAQFVLVNAQLIIHLLVELHLGRNSPSLSVLVKTGYQKSILSSWLLWIHCTANRARHSGLRLFWQIKHASWRLHNSGPTPIAIDTPVSREVSPCCVERKRSIQDVC